MNKENGQSPQRRHRPRPITAKIQMTYKHVKKCSSTVLEIRKIKITNNKWWLHSSVNILKTTELFTQEMSKFCGMWMLSQQNYYEK